MTDTQSRFEQAALAAKSLPERPDNESLLQLYALFKQASAGNVSGDKPGFFDFVAIAKYEAWEKHQGLSRENAQEQYISLVTELGGQIEE